MITKRMRVYRVAYHSKDLDALGEHTGYSYHRNEREAKQKADSPDDVTHRDIDIDPDGVIAILNFWADHPDNG